ncbi:MAG: hypothetical protein QM484_00360 [Woeseiaceae bacterium]
MDNKKQEPDSLVDALESIKKLLAKSDSKLAAARESIAIASNQTALGQKGVQEQLNIPVLDDIVIPTEIESIADKIDETIPVVNETIPTLSLSSAEPDPQVMLDYLDSLEKSLEKTLRNALMKSIVTIESELKKSLSSEIDKVREQIIKDFK